MPKSWTKWRPGEIIAESSPLWECLRKAYALGYHKMNIPEEYGGLGLSPIQISLIYEEFEWASFGLAVQIGAAAIPFGLPCRLQAEDLIRHVVTPFVECEDASIRGCWAITEPDHGSGTLIEDGSNDILAIAGGHQVIETSPRG